MKIKPKYGVLSQLMREYLKDLQLHFHMPKSSSYETLILLRSSSLLCGII